MSVEKFLSAFEGLRLDFDSVLVALSGGADSVALLDMVTKYSKKNGFSVYAAHVNHNIRTEDFGHEALRDEHFCRELCASLGVELFVLSIDIPSLSEKSGDSVETVARNARYDFFSALMREHGIRLLLTAHNADDNLETQIFNLCRGCGIGGMAGIPVLRELPDMCGHVFRPLIGLTKAEILSYCRENGLSYVTDSTNLCDDYTRNRIRHKIIPELEEMFTDPQRMGMRLALFARDDSEYLNRQAKDIFEKFPSGTVPLEAFNPLHPSLKRRILRLACRSSLEAVHLASLIELCERSVPHSRISLPGGTVGSIEGGCLIFGAEEEKKPSNYSIKLTEGFNKIPSCEFGVLICDEAPKDLLEIDGEIYKLYTHTRIKNATMDALSARPRKEGDTVRSAGMTKKVKKLLCDKKIPLCERDLPLIVSGEDIIYVPMCAVDDRYFTKDKTQKGIFIYKTEKH